jgi:hypothetical protein
MRIENTMRRMYLALEDEARGITTDFGVDDPLTVRFKESNVRSAASKTLWILRIPALAGVAVKGLTRFGYLRVYDTGESILYGIAPKFFHGYDPFPERRVVKGF